jgi:predicted transcriptional regulator
MIFHMKQVLVQLDDRMAALLETVAPGRSRKRSEFIRQALAQALLQVSERRTRAAYARTPQPAAGFEVDAWAPASEAIHPPTRRVR